MGEYAKSVPLMNRALKITEKALGANHPDTATHLANLAVLYDYIGEYAKAEPLLIRALEIREKGLGANHPDTERNLNNLAVLYVSMGEYAKAEPLLSRVLEIQEKTLGPEHPSAATALSNLAVLYQSMGHYTKAEPLLTRALMIQKKALGPDHPDSASILNNLAGVYYDMGEYAKAESLHTRALNISEKVLGPDHPKTAASLNNLANLYSSMGEYAKAEPLMNRALKIKEKALGPNHPSTALSLNNTAAFYCDLGEYAKAEPLYIRALKIKEKALGPDHPDTGATLNSLGLLYKWMGEYAKAEPLCTRALKIYEKSLGPDHPDTVRSLSSLANLYENMGDYAKAEPLYTRALKINEKALGPDHPSTATSLLFLAGLCEVTGEYAKAGPLYTRALEINEKALGPDHPDTARSLNNLGNLYASMGEHAKAEPLHARALKIFEKSLGPAHPATAASLGSLTFLYFETQRFEQAREHLARAAEIGLSNRGRSGGTALQRSSSAAAQRVSICINGVVCLSLKLGTNDFDPLALGERGRAAGLRELLSEARARADAPLSEADFRRVSEALRRITALTRSIDALASKSQPTQEQQEELTRAELAYDQLLAELSGQYAQFVATESARGLSTEEAMASTALDDKTAVLTWHTWRGLTWGGIVRQSGVHWVDLSETVDAEKEAEHVRQVRLAGGQPSASLTQAAPHLRALYQSRVAPLERHLDGIEHLVVVAQGWAATVPLEMLLTGAPKTDAAGGTHWPWLTDKYKVSYVSSMTTLDILAREREERKAHEWRRELFVLGDPPFSAAQLAEMNRDEPDQPQPHLNDSLALSRTIRFDRDADPPRLPGTRLEAQSITRTLGARDPLSLIGPDATERGLFALSASGDLAECRYVHLATHGFIDPDRPELSGLVLARAPVDADYDGVLHMREVFNLKLKADLVVLSACQTGLGKNISGEGMVGLSMAFLYAGTPSVVVSLWKVDDLATALLMNRFYTHLKAGKHKADALHEAKHWLRTLTRKEVDQLVSANADFKALARGLGSPQRSDKGEQVAGRPFAHPHYWAAFVLAGDPE